MKSHKRLEAIKEINHHDMLQNPTNPKFCRRYRSAGDWLSYNYDFYFHFCDYKMVATIDNRGEVAKLEHEDTALPINVVDDIFNFVTDSAIKLTYIKLTGEVLC